MAAAVTVTAPFPVPLAPLVTVNHAALLVAVQPHPAGVVTETDALPPAGATLTVVDDRVYVHDTPACATVTVLPATVSVALRDEDALLAVTV